MKKRILRYLMVLALCLTLLSAAALAAGPHSHTLCSHLESCPDPAHETAHSAEVVFEKELTEELLASNRDALPSGAYYLSGALFPEDRIRITGTVTICLNGKKIESQKATEPVFLIEGGGTLTLTDCVGTGTVTHASGVTGCGVQVNGSTFNLYGGKITGNKANYNYGGGVYVYSSGTNSAFNMYGGEISGNTVTNGGGVYVKSGTFTMSGGEISGNTVTYGGGGVYVANGNFTVSGTAVIENNKGANSADNNVCLPGQTIAIGTDIPY